MDKRFEGIRAGLKAAVESLAATPMRFRVGDIAIKCPVCGHDEFDKKSMLMNTTGMTFMGLDWLNDSACALVCKRCGRIELFADSPEER